MNRDEPIRIVVADDQPMVRDAFAELLGTQSDFDVVGLAATGASAVRLTETLHPDVVLMDVRMPEMDGIEATRRITESELSKARVLILTTFDLDQYVYDALRAGASGFLLKDATAERLFDAVRVVAVGDALIAPAITRRLIHQFAEPPKSSSSRTELESLTPRELEVLRLIAQGLSNVEIGRSLVITEETVKTHISRILRKLDLRDRTQAVIAAYESGLVIPDHPAGPSTL
jgi:DNA-binding NarL/FixJ family response regulator